jgi:hypothetical protein
MPPDRRSSLISVLRRLEAWGHARRWTGSDPYEGLNATRLVGPLASRPLGQRLVIQTVKRCPVDLRPILGIPSGRNAAAVACVVSAYAHGGFLPADVSRRRLHAALDVLDSLRCDRYAGGWGYHFAFRSRSHLCSAGTPNTIATAFAGLALLDAHAATAAPAAPRAARAAGAFFLEHVPQVGDHHAACFGYLPGDRTPIHNANMLAASLLARLAATGGRDAPEFGAAARRAVRWTVARQRPDGSWPYGERRNLGWVDGFHTGYVLDALRACADEGLGEGSEEAWRRGLAFYRRALLADGTPRYSTASVYPLDAQSAAQAIQTLSIAARRLPGCLDHAWAVYDFARARMWRRDGLPVFQRRRMWANRAPHVRWVVAPTVLALTQLLHAESAPARALEATA